MIEWLKKYLYFPLAWYFRFFASIKLRRWHPQIVVVTGSNGKTTLLHLLESQIGDKAKYSHHANSSYGVPFDILGLHRKSLRQSEWVSLFFKAPILAFSKTPKEKIYIVEADCDRPGEGKFLAEFLRPEVSLWVSTGKTHSANFDRLVSSEEFQTVEEAIAFEYGYFLEYSSKLSVIDGNSELQLQQKSRTNAEVLPVKESISDLYHVTKEGTTFDISGGKYIFPFLLPREVATAIVMCKETVDYLGLPFNPSFSKFTMPPGRGSVFAGIKQMTLIDSTYNANLGSIKAMLVMFSEIKEKKKWVVLGDMLELGKEEQEEHEKLAKILATMELERVILVGRLTAEYTYPSLRAKANQSLGVMSFVDQKQALSYLSKNIQGGETILFKASQSLVLEGLIEQLLQDKSTISKLPRRGKFWDGKRKQKGF